MKENILFVEDDASLRTTLTDRLCGENYTVDSAKDAEEAMDKITDSCFDLFIIDVMLPCHNGFDLCRHIRQAGLATPILFLTAKTDLVDKVVGLRIGGDDYMTKPFEAGELIARIEALLRRSPTHTGRGVHNFGPLQIDVGRNAVTRDGKPINLTDREFQLLCHLIKRAGQTVPRLELLQAVWGYDSELYTRTVDVHVFTLRRKLEEDPTQPELIKTIRGVGYKFIRT